VPRLFSLPLFTRVRGRCILGTSRGPNLVMNPGLSRSLGGPTHASPCICGLWADLRWRDLAAPCYGCRAPRASTAGATLREARELSQRLGGSRDRPRQPGGFHRSGRLRPARQQRHGRRLLRVARAGDRRPGARGRLRHGPGRHPHRPAGVRRDRPGRRPRHAETGAQQSRRSARTLDRGRRAHVQPGRRAVPAHLLDG
jgi:hypothetical protein